MILSTVAARKSTYDLLGIFASPRNKAGCHAKKSSVGNTTANSYKRESIKAGNTVSVGKGQNIVGKPEPSNPIEAGIINAMPQRTVTSAVFGFGGNGLLSPQPPTVCAQ